MRGEHLPSQFLEPRPGRDRLLNREELDPPGESGRRLPDRDLLPVVREPLGCRAESTRAEHRGVAPDLECSRDHPHVGRLIDGCRGYGDVPGAIVAGQADRTVVGEHEVIREQRRERSPIPRRVRAPEVAVAPDHVLVLRTFARDVSLVELVQRRVELGVAVGCDRLDESAFVRLDHVVLDGFESVGRHDAGPRHGQAFAPDRDHVEVGGMLGRSVRERTCRAVRDVRGRVHIRSAFAQLVQAPDRVVVLVVVEQLGPADAIVVVHNREVVGNPAVLAAVFGGHSLVLEREERVPDDLDAAVHRHFVRRDCTTRAGRFHVKLAPADAEAETLVIGEHVAGRQQLIDRVEVRRTRSPARPGEPSAHP